MADRRVRESHGDELLPWSGLHTPYRDAREQSLTASAEILTVDNTRSLVIPPLEWQRECWAFYHTLGELRFAIGTWLANAASKVRLIAAVKRVGEDTPSPVVDGPVAQIVASLGGGIDGQAAILKRQMVQLNIPGDSYLVGEDPSGMGDLEQMQWTCYSSDEIRIKQRQTKTVLGGAGVVTYEVNTYRNEWRDLAPESMVVRCWQPDEQFAWAATSPCQAALPILREVDFYNRYIIACLMSRLASNGMLLIPQEVTFPAKPQFKDAPDPFVAELIDIASRSIKNPGSASAAVPMPLKVPAQYIELFKHLTFDTALGKEVMENRTRALERLATTINIPTEVITGMKNMNHWGQWQLEESAIKMYITPPIEVLASCYTRGFLYPVLDSLNLPHTAPDGGQYIVWYDASELAQQPDRTDEAQAMYDRGELSGHALRRESGFEEDDKPSDEEFKEIALKKITLAGGADALTALAKLTGDESLAPPPPAPAPAAGGDDASGGDATPSVPESDQPPAAGQSPSGQDKEAPNTRNGGPQAPQRQTLRDVDLLPDPLLGTKVRVR
jgi:hypothetical protein